MAIDISPLYTAVQSNIDCEIHDGNLNYTPLDINRLTAVFTCLASKFIATPRILQKPGSSDSDITEVWTRPVQYLYQLDIYKQYPVQSQQVSTAPPFELEAMTIIDSINSQAPALSQAHNLGVFSLDNVTYSSESYVGNLIIHRATVQFNIIATSLVKFSNDNPRIKCIQFNTTPLEF